MEFYMLFSISDTQKVAANKLDSSFLLITCLNTGVNSLSILLYFVGSLLL